MLAFCHIEKTAGNSILFLLKRYYGNKLMCARYSQVYNYDYEYLKKDLKLFSKVSCVSSHGLKPFLDYGPFDEKMDWFTFLREPHKRYLSHYLHQRAYGIEKYNITFEEWMEKYGRKNWMVRAIAGEENLDKAIEIIERKDIFIGLLDHFDESLSLLKEKYKLSGMSLDISEHKNIVKDKSLKNEILENWKKHEGIVTLNNELDTGLYQYAKEIVWPKQLAEIKKTEITHNDKIIPEWKQKMNLGAYSLQHNLWYKKRMEK